MHTKSVMRMSDKQGKDTAAQVMIMMIPMGEIVNRARLNPCRASRVGAGEKSKVAEESECMDMGPRNSE